MGSVSKTAWNKRPGPHRRADVVPRRAGDRTRGRHNRPPAGALWSLVISVIITEFLHSRQSFLLLFPVPSLYLLSLAESLVMFPGVRSSCCVNQLEEWGKGPAAEPPFSQMQLSGGWLMPNPLGHISCLGT